MELEYYNQYIEYVEYYRLTVIIRKRRIVAAAVVAMYLLKKIYKVFWINF